MILLLKDGKVYSTYMNKEFTQSKRNLLRDNICPAKSV